MRGNSMSGISPARDRRGSPVTLLRWKIGTSTRNIISGSCEVKGMTAELTYKSNLLIGVRENGVMTVIADWPHLPRQSEVQDRINDARNGYVSFALCTPTSIMPAGSNGGHSGRSRRDK